MAGPSTVNFGNLIAPDVAAQQLQLQRQQQLVDMLRQQAITPTPTETAGGMAVRQSPFVGLAKMASAYLSGKRQTDIDEKSLGLNKEMAQRYAQILAGGGAPGAASDDSAPASAPIDPNAVAALSQGAAAGSVGPTATNAQRMSTMPPAADAAPQISPAPLQGSSGPLSAPAQGPAPVSNSFNMANLLRGSVVGQLGGDSAASAYWDQFKVPEGIKTSDMLGMQRSEMAAALRREQAAKGQTMVREGSTIAQTNPDGSITPKFTAPDLKQGANLTWNGGVPQAAPIQGLSEINASMAGAQTGAQERAKSERDMVTVNTPQGPKMMTRAQAVQLANGGAPGAGGAPIAPPALPRGPQPVIRPTAGNPPPGAGMVPPQSPVDRVAVLQQQLTQAQRGIADPGVNDADRQRLQRDAADIQGEMARMATTNGQPNGLAAGGIPLQTEGQQKFEQTMGSNQANVLDDGYKKAKVAADDLLGIDQSRKALQGGVFVGSGAETKLAIAKFLNGNIPGINISPEKVGNTDYLKSTLGKGLLDQAKTLGSNPSNADANRINDIVGSIGKDPQALAKILDWRQQMSERSIQMHNSNVGQAVKNGFQPQFDMTVKNPVNSSDIDALLRKYGGK